MLSRTFATSLLYLTFYKSVVVRETGDLDLSLLFDLPGLCTTDKSALQTDDSNESKTTKFVTKNIGNKSWIDFTLSG